jgi:hypothetical protein
VKLRQDWLDAIKQHPERYSIYLPTPGKWYADHKSLMGFLGCSRGTARKLEAILDYQILPSLPPPTTQQKEPFRNTSPDLTNPNFSYTVNKEYVWTKEQQAAYIPAKPGEYPDQARIRYPEDELPPDDTEVGEVPDDNEVGELPPDEGEEPPSSTEDY